jgi:mono/diheme cytochrome c family protein
MFRRMFPTQIDPRPENTRPMSPISRTLSVVAALGLAACASGSSEPAPAPAPAPTPAQAPAAQPAPAAGGGGGALTNLYSTAQANRGRDQFRSMCAECHTVPEFSDNAFKLKWSRRTLGDLYTFIHQMMPDSAPGILTPQQAADLTAYILQLNEVPAGSAQLPPDEARLNAISLAGLRS